MYKNLEAELARKGIKRLDIAKKCRRRYATVIDKLNGKAKISLDEAREIRDEFFPEMTLDYLFAKDSKQRPA